VFGTFYAVYIERRNEKEALIALVSMFDNEDGGDSVNCSVF